MEITSSSTGSGDCVITEADYSYEFALVGSNLEFVFDAAASTSDVIIDYTINGSGGGYWMSQSGNEFTHTVSNVNQGDALRVSFRIFQNGAQTITGWREFVVGNCESAARYANVSTTQQSSVAIQPIAFPNPANDKLTVVGVGELSAYRIYSNVGKLILQGKGSQVEVSDLKTGLYFLHYENLKPIRISIAH